MEWNTQSTTWFLCCIIALVDMQVSSKFSLDTGEEIILENASTNSSDISDTSRGIINFDSHLSQDHKKAPDFIRLNEYNSDPFMTSSSDIDQVPTFHHDDRASKRHWITKKDSDRMTNPTTKVPIMLYRGHNKPRQPYLERPPARKSQYSERSTALRSKLRVRNPPDIDADQEPFRAPRFVTNKQDIQQTNVPYYEDYSQQQSPLLSKYTTADLPLQTEATSWSNLQNDKSTVFQLNGYGDISVLQEPLLPPPDDNAYESNRNLPVHTSRSNGQRGPSGEEDIIDNSHYNYPRKLNYDIQSGGVYDTTESIGNDPLNMWRSRLRNETMTPGTRFSTWDARKNPHGTSNINNFELNFNDDNRAQFEESFGPRNVKKINEPLSDFNGNEKDESGFGVTDDATRAANEDLKVGHIFELEQLNRRREYNDKNSEFSRAGVRENRPPSNFPPNFHSESKRLNHIRDNNYINDNNYIDTNFSFSSQPDFAVQGRNNNSFRRQRGQRGQRSRLRMRFKPKINNSELSKNTHPSQNNQHDLNRNDEFSFATTAAIENTYANIELRRIYPPSRLRMNSKSYTTQPEVITDGNRSRRLFVNNSIVKSNTPLPYRHFNSYNERNG